MALFVRFCRDQAGSIYILFAGILLMILAALALTVDVGGGYVRHENVQQALRNATQEPAKELLYMWLRCRTNAGPRETHLLPKCVSDKEALDILHGHIQRFVSNGIADATRVTVHRPEIRTTEQGVFLYTTATFELTAFFRFWDRESQTVTLESNRLIVDCTAEGTLKPTLFLTDDDADPHIVTDGKKTVALGLRALESVGYRVEPICRFNLPDAEEQKTAPCPPTLLSAVPLLIDSPDTRRTCTGSAKACAMGNAAADMAYGLAVSSRSLARETAQGEADAFRR